MEIIHIQKEKKINAYTGMLHTLRKVRAIRFHIIWYVIFKPVHILVRQSLDICSTEYDSKNRGYKRFWVRSQLEYAPKIVKGYIFGLYSENDTVTQVNNLGMKAKYSKHFHLQLFKRWL